MKSNPIPIVYACDDNFVKYTIVSLFSMIKNADPTRSYRVYILNTNIKKQMQQEITKLACGHFQIALVNVTEYLESIKERLPVRDYYTKTTYFRFFIPELFPEYDKVIYIDSDTVVQGDISKLFDTDIGDRCLGACHEQAMVQVDTYGTYAEQVVGVDRHAFFNAGLMLMNTARMRREGVLQKFLSLLRTYDFVVTQDEDYLNLIAKDHVFFLDPSWNLELIGELPCPPEQANVIHYMMVSKPWHYRDCRHGDIFWKYAEQTSVYGQILNVLNSYTDQMRLRDARSAEDLLALARAEIERPDNYKRRVNEGRNRERVGIVEKIEEYERTGNFFSDVENDPPTRPIARGEVDYYCKRPSSKLSRHLAYTMAKQYLKKILRDKRLIVKEIVGLENLAGLDTGAVLTSNHFNPLDTFAIHVAYLRAGHGKRKLYRVIREGNYTSFPGFYGYLMRHFYTLPLASDRHVLKEFLDAASELLRRGNLVLVYPEQSMWWNYRKPKPLREGAFTIAARAGVPTVPCFITMQDSDTLGEDGFPVQEYTVHIGVPIRPDQGRTPRENAKEMMRATAAFMQKTYEDFYGMPLVYKHS